MTDAVHPVLRRSLTAAAVLLTVAAIAALVMLLRGVPSDESGLGESFRYDLSTLRKVDPALIVADEEPGFAAGVPRPSVLALGPSNAVYVAGAGEIARFDLDGRRESSFKVSAAVTAMAVDREDGRVFAAFGDRVEILGADGAGIGAWHGLNSNSVFSAIVLLGKSAFVADAGNRLVLRYGMDGVLQSRFGDKTSEYSEGFVIPSPYFPLVAGVDESLWVVDTGRHRFINLTQDGRIRSRWEKAGMSIQGFCGCCNPTHFAVRDDGSFVTAEKGLVRVKVHAADGSLVGVVAAPDKFGADTRGLSLVVDGRGRVLVLDPERGEVRIFKMRNGDKGTRNGSEGVRFQVATGGIAGWRGE